MVLPEDDQTTITTTVPYPSKDARDAGLERGVKDGMSMGFDRLDEYLRTVS